MPLQPTVTKIGSATYQYDWSGTSPYYVYQDGVAILTNTTDTSVIVTASDPLEPPAIEVLDADDTDTAESLLYSPRATLQWRGVSGVRYYRVDLYTGGAWVAQLPIVRETGQGYLQWTSQPITDVTTHQFRVVAVDGYGYESAPVAFDSFIVRNPEPPSISMTYESGPSSILVEAR